MKEICGFYPNWISPNLYQSLRYDALTTIAWFGLKVQSDGSLLKEAYPPTSLISYAHSKGKKVVVTLISEWGSTVIDTILSNTNLQNTVINNLLAEVRGYGFDGVDIDFEGFPPTNRINGQSNRSLFTQFISSLSNKFWSYNRNYRLSIDLPPVDWDNAFDTSTLSNYVNYLMIMGYDYHWEGGPTAGAVAPLDRVTDSVNKYLATIPRNKLLLGVPYYGYEWPTQSSQPDSPTTGKGIAVRYYEVLTKLQTYPRRWHVAWSSPYYLTGNGQGWYDDTQSLGLKFDLVNQKQLAGIGIWALGFDGGRPELSDLVVNKMSGVSITCPQGQTNILGTCILTAQIILGGAVVIGIMMLTEGDSDD